MSTKSLTTVEKKGMKSGEKRKLLLSYFLANNISFSRRFFFNSWIFVFLCANPQLSMNLFISTRFLNTCFLFASNIYLIVGSKNNSVIWKSHFIVFCIMQYINCKIFISSGVEIHQSISPKTTNR